MKTTPEQRIEMARRHAVGETYAEIAQHMQINIATVRYWCRQLRRGRSSQTHWSRGKVGILSQFAPELAATILALRQAHPGWGPDRLVDELKRRAAPGERVPSRATVGRLLHSHHQYRRPKRQRVEPVAPAPAQAVHECWEIDFKLKIGLGDGLRYNLTTVREVAGGACLYAWLSCAEQFDAQGRRTGASKHVSVDELMLCLRTVFAQFGTLPQRIQTDNETVFVGSTSDDFPGRFTLWLWGLGIEHVRTRPGVPTDNAHVERCHQTIYNYALRGQLKRQPDALQADLLIAVERHLFSLSSRAKGCNGQPPAQVYPELFQRPCPYQPELEPLLFQLARVDQQLARRQWRRRVGKNGQVSIGGQHEYYSVGNEHARQYVLVTFDPRDRTFVFWAEQPDAPGTPAHEICRLPARNLTIHDILGPLHVHLPQLSTLITERLHQPV